MDKKNKPRHDEDTYRGVDVNKADNGREDKKLVNQEIRELNNNPRNNDLDE